MNCTITLRRGLALLGLLLAVAAPAAWAAPQRVALVVGNAAYAQKPLRNPVNDATDLATALRAAGFEVLERKNRSADELRRDLADFQDKLGPGTTALFYFAGHGVQLAGANYLLPTDIRGEAEDQVRDDALLLQKVLDDLLLKNCRQALQLGELGF